MATMLQPSQLYLFIYLVHGWIGKTFDQLERTERSSLHHNGQLSHPQQIEFKEYSRRPQPEIHLSSTIHTNAQPNRVLVQRAEEQRAAKDLQDQDGNEEQPLGHSLALQG